MKNILETRFSKIGTNPMRYLENYLLHINRLKKGENFLINNLKVKHNDVIIFEANSDATFRQNIDAWIWMGFLIKINDDHLIKIVNKMTEQQLIEHTKFSLLLESDEKLVNIHRNTILTKLISLILKRSINPNYTYEEVIKECGKYENVLISDKKYVDLIVNYWGGKDE